MGFNDYISVVFSVFKFCLTKQKYHLFTCEHLELIVVISHLCLDYWPDLKTMGVFYFKNFVLVIKGQTMRKKRK